MGIPDLQIFEKQSLIPSSNACQECVCAESHAFLVSDDGVVDVIVHTAPQQSLLRFKTRHPPQFSFTEVVGMCGFASMEVCAATGRIVCCIYRVNVSASGAIDGVDPVTSSVLDVGSVDADNRAYLGFCDIPLHLLVLCGNRLRLLDVSAAAATAPAVVWDLWTPRWQSRFASLCHGVLVYCSESSVKVIDCRFASTRDVGGNSKILFSISPTVASKADAVPLDCVPCAGRGSAASAAPELSTPPISVPEYEHSFSFAHPSDVPIRPTCLTSRSFPGDTICALDTTDGVVLVCCREAGYIFSVSERAWVQTLSFVATASGAYLHAHGLVFVRTRAGIEIWAATSVPSLRSRHTPTTSSSSPSLSSESPSSSSTASPSVLLSPSSSSSKLPEPSFVRLQPLIGLHSISIPRVTADVIYAVTRFSFSENVSFAAVFPRSLDVSDDADDADETGSVSGFVVSSDGDVSRIPFAGGHVSSLLSAARDQNAAEPPGGASDLSTNVYQLTVASLSQIQQELQQVLESGLADVAKDKAHAMEQVACCISCVHCFPSEAVCASLLATLASKLLALRLFPGEPELLLYHAGASVETIVQAFFPDLSFDADPPVADAVELFRRLYVCVRRVLLDPASSQRLVLSPQTALFVLRLCRQLDPLSLSSMILFSPCKSCEPVRCLQLLLSLSAPLPGASGRGAWKPVSPFDSFAVSSCQYKLGQTAESMHTLGLVDPSALSMYFSTAAADLLRDEARFRALALRFGEPMVECVGSLDDAALARQFSGFLLTVWRDEDLPVLELMLLCKLVVLDLLDLSQRSRLLLVFLKVWAAASVNRTSSSVDEGVFQQHYFLTVFLDTVLLPREAHLTRPKWFSIACEIYPTPELGMCEYVLELLRAGGKTLIQEAYSIVRGFQQEVQLPSTVLDLLLTRCLELADEHVQAFAMLWAADRQLAYRFTRDHARDIRDWKSILEIDAACFEIAATFLDEDTAKTLPQTVRGEALQRAKANEMARRIIQKIVAETP